jgi:uncharacterized membrane protein
MPEIEASVDVAVDVRTAYDQWTQFESFPRFMSDVRSVKQLDERHLHWVVEVGGRLREWDAEIVVQIPDERIAWRSLEGTPNDGEVSFRPLTARDEPPLTRVTLTMVYDPNDWVAAASEALGLANRRARTNLDDFKRFIEDRGSETGAWRGEIAS